MQKMKKVRVILIAASAPSETLDFKRFGPDLDQIVTGP